MTSSEIYQLRKSFGMSTIVFAKILSISIVTIKRYEAGSHVAKGAPLLLMKLLKNDPTLIKQYILINKSKLTDEELKSLDTSYFI